MHIEVDQSGKIEQLGQDTIIACSNNKQYCITIPKKIKQSIYYNYKTKIKQLKYKLFCIGVYYCIEHILSKCELIVIDDEYHGKNDLICQKYTTGPLISGQSPLSVLEGGIFLSMLKNHLNYVSYATNMPPVYDGWFLTKSILFSYIRKKFVDFDEKMIRFSRISKNSNAHHVAIETFREEHKPNEVISEKQIWGLLK